MNNKLKHACDSFFLEEQIKGVEDHYQASFVGEFALYDYATQSGALFYQENPKPDHANYFLIYACPVDTCFKISSGVFMAEKVRSGIITPKGDFIYSRHRHDYIVHDKCMIDGGDAYLKYSGNGNLISFKIEKDRMKIITNA